MKQKSDFASSSIRVLSPSMLPPVMGEDGSMAKTAIFFPDLTRKSPRASIKLLLPTPGGPLMAMRSELPQVGSNFANISSASARCSGRVLSVNVIARASQSRDPDWIS
jgi:hypothetical protein